MVPVGLERVGDESVGGVDGEVAASAAYWARVTVLARMRSTSEARWASSALTWNAASIASGLSCSSTSAASALSMPCPEIDWHDGCAVVVCSWRQT
ncbi:MAG: hypothetical protein ACLP0J_17035 [Solirubrobacteraceae bacterium]